MATFALQFKKHFNINVIEAGAKVNFIAGNSITLKPGFKTLAGSKFNATIGDCSSSLKSIKINDEKLSRDNPPLPPICNRWLARQKEEK